MRKGLVLTIVLAVALVMTISFGIPAAEAGSASCETRVNNNSKKLLECVTLDGVRTHQAAFQAIADANGGTRASGTPGYDASADYVADLMEAAGYNVTVQTFVFDTFRQLGPSTLQQTAPGSVTYVEETDYNMMSFSAAGDVTAAVTAVDLQLGLGNTNSSGCQAADFIGFPPGDIALIQRNSFCTFQLKAENAAAAGAVGAIIFNQGNTEDREGLVNGTLGPTYAGGIPVFFATYDRGEEWDATPVLELHMVADVSTGPFTTSNIIAETLRGRDDQVVVVGAQLDSVFAGPGINNNGSGAAAILEVALQMKRVTPVNKVRFIWFGAEEDGLRGSDYYVNNLTDEELNNIMLYLNFNTIGSPNFVRFILDGDDAIEALFEDFYGALGVPSESTPFLSSAFPFFAEDIPVGGLFTGTNGIKTDAQVALFGGTAGDQYDPCWHLACDTFDNVNLVALEQNADAAAFAVIQNAMGAKAKKKIKIKLKSSSSSLAVE